MTDFRAARDNMVESQVRPNGVTDRRVIDAMAAVAREAFLPKAAQAIAYMDEEIAIKTSPEGGATRHLMDPMNFARLVHLADISGTDLVLDVGCGLGYSSAVLSRVAEAVVSLECDEDLAREAIDIMVEQNVDNAAVVTGPLNGGYESEGPYDAIVLNGAVPVVPRELLNQLKEGGRLVAVVGEEALGRAHLFIRHGDVFAEKVAFDATISPLPGFTSDEPAFVF